MSNRGYTALPTGRCCVLPLGFALLFLGSTYPCGGMTGEALFLDCQFESGAWSHSIAARGLSYRFMIGMHLGRALRIGDGAARPVQMSVSPDGDLLLSGHIPGQSAWLITVRRDGVAVLSRHDLRPAVSRNGRRSQIEDLTVQQRGRCSEQDGTA